MVAENSNETLYVVNTRPFAYTIPSSNLFVCLHFLYLFRAFYRAWSIGEHHLLTFITFA